MIRHEIFANRSRISIGDRKRRGCARCLLYVLSRWTVASAGGSGGTSHAAVCEMLWDQQPASFTAGKTYGGYQGGGQPTTIPPNPFVAQGTVQGPSVGCLYISQEGTAVQFVGTQSNWWWCAAEQFVVYGSNGTAQRCDSKHDRVHDKPLRCDEPRGGNPIYPLTGVKRQAEPVLRWSISGEPLSLSYVYVESNPLSYVDPNGLQVALPPLVVPNLGVPGPAGDAQQQLAQQLTDALRRAFPDKTYQTYTRYNPTTGKCYSGRTSGYEDPLTNIRNRALGQPLLNIEGFLPPVLDRSSANKDAIRGREQQLIDVNGGARSAGGTSRNMINSISPINPFRNGYLDEAIGEFGMPVPTDNCTCQ